MFDPNSRSQLWLGENLICPRDRGRLENKGRTLICANGHTYPCIDGIPIMLVGEALPTHGVCNRTMERVKDEPRIHGQDPIGDDGIDPFVQQAVAGTCGIIYQPLIGQLSRYPIPEIRLPPVSGDILVDIGCNWGRWCISAARKGYSVVGVDPSIDAILAARRVSQQLGLAISYIVGDARFLPFKLGSVATVFSYSVLQHFSKSDARKSLEEVARVLEPGGTCLIQMPNTFGVRCLHHQVKRFLNGSRGRDIFEVRYWQPGELMAAFSQAVGPSDLSVDGYFGLGIQSSDIDLLPFKYRAVVRASEFLRTWSEGLPAMKYLADSLYVRSIREVH